MTKKKEIRAEILALRKQMTALDVAAKSHEIVCRLVEVVPWDKVKTVLAYLPVHNEVDLQELFFCLWRQKKRVLVPVCLPELQGEMQAALLLPEDLLDLRVNWFGILEPNLPHFVLPSEIDLVLVPGVAFDRQKGRLGYGGGFYDRFLPKLSLDCLKVGVGFALQVVENLPLDAADCLMDAVITEDLII